MVVGITIDGTTTFLFVYLYVLGILAVEFPLLLGFFWLFFLTHERCMYNLHLQE